MPWHHLLEINKSCFPQASPYMQLPRTPPYLGTRPGCRRPRIRVDSTRHLELGGSTDGVHPGEWIAKFGD